MIGMKETHSIAVGKVSEGQFTESVTHYMS